MRRKRSLRGLGAMPSAHADSAIEAFETAIEDFKDAIEESKPGAKQSCRRAAKSLMEGLVGYGIGVAHEGSTYDTRGLENDEYSKRVYHASDLQLPRLKKKDRQAEQAYLDAKEKFMDNCIVGKGLSGLAGRRRRRSR